MVVSGWGRMQRLGPGLLWAGTAVGVSHLVQSTRAGVGYGLTLWWVVLAAHALRYPAFEAGPRYASATGKSLLDGYRQQGRWTLALFGLMTLATMGIVQAAVTLVTAGMASALITDRLSPVQWSAVLSVVAGVVVAVGRYTVLDRLMKAMMLVLSLTTLGAVVLLLPHVEGAALSLWPPLPTLDPANIAFLVAFVGWMPAPFDTSVWHSQWSVEKAHTEGKVPFKEARFDFHVGYAGTAVLALCFLFLGAGVLHGTGQEVPVAAPAFAAMLVDVYASILGPAARPVILLAAFTTMLSTTLAVTDGYPRAMAGALAAWRGEDAPERPAERRGTLLLLLALAMGVIVWFAANLKGLVDFATTVSFVFTPLLAVFNYRSLRLPGVPEGFRLSVAGIWAHRLAIGAMSLGSLAYLGWRFL